MKSSQEAVKDLNSITRNRFSLLKSSSLLFVQDFFNICLLSIEKAIFWAWVGKAKTANCQNIEMNKFRSGHGVIGVKMAPYTIRQKNAKKHPFSVVRSTVRHENGEFRRIRKRASNPRSLKTPALRFSLD